MKDLEIQCMSFCLPWLRTSMIGSNSPEVQRAVRFETGMYGGQVASSMESSIRLIIGDPCLEVFTYSLPIIPKF